MARTLQSSKSRTAPFHGDDPWCNSGLECHLEVVIDIWIIR